MHSTITKTWVWEDSKGYYLLKPGTPKIFTADIYKAAQGVPTELVQKEPMITLLRTPVTVITTILEDV